MARWRFADGRLLSKKQVAALKRGQRALRAMQKGAKKKKTKKRRKSSPRGPRPLKKAASVVRSLIGRWL